MAEKLSTNFVKHFFDIYRGNKKMFHQTENSIYKDSNVLHAVRCRRGDLKTRRKEMPSHT